jgi:hypothetical protein
MTENTEKVVEPIIDDGINYKLGLYIALMGAFIGLVVYPIIFLDQYKFMMDAEYNKLPNEPEYIRNGCRSIVQWYYPAFTDVGILSGMLFLLTGVYGFRNKEKWAYPAAIIANVLVLMTSFWPIVPALDTGNFPYYIFIFLPGLGMYVGFTRYVKQMPWSRVIFGMLVGMAMITSFMNGIASTQRMMTLPDALYKITQRINWFAGIGYIAVVVGILLQPKAIWLKRTLFIVITAELFMGYLLGLTMTIAKGTFSMFLLGPIFTTIITIVILARKWDAVVKPDL